ncbi:hypothetical protein [Streptomyces sp. NPDC055912]
MAKETAAQLLAEARRTYAQSAPQRAPQAVAAAQATAARHAHEARGAKG